MTQSFGKSIRHKTYIAVPREKVFDTITTARGWNSFFTNGLEMDPVPGGKIVWRWKNWGPDFNNLESPGKVIDIRRPGLFVFEWGSRHPTTITIKLSSQYGGTVIDLTEDGYLDTAEDRAMILECAAGWGEALTLLKFFLEHGIIYSRPLRS